MNQKQLVVDTSKIKTTNLGPCYARSFTDIPLSKELSDIVEAKKAHDIYWKGKSSMEIVVPMMEARYKAIDELVKRSGIKQVVEIAAGWAPRGMIMTKDPVVNYIETDQDVVEMEQKKIIQEKLLGEKRPNLHCVFLNAVTGEGISGVEEKLGSGPVCVVHEGLFRYFSHDLKIQTAKIIRDILLKHGGVYITPDILTEKETEELNQVVPMDKINEKHSKSTGTNIKANHFKDEAEAERLFANVGFKVKMYKWGDFVDKFSCLQHPNLDKKLLEAVIEVIKKREIWVMNL